MPVGLLGEQRKTTSGRCSRTCATACATVQREVLVAPAVDPRGAGAGGEQRVHRVRRGEAERGAPGAAEGLQQLLLDLVGAVGRPDVGAGQPVPEVGGEVGAQRDRVPVGVAVEVAQPRADSAFADRVDDVVGHRVGVLVGVEPDRRRRAAARRTGVMPAQFVAERQVVERVTRGEPRRHRLAVRGQVLRVGQGRPRGSATSRSASSSYSTTWTPRRNVCTDRPEECRAQPPVGSTWLEPAQ